MTAAGLNRCCRRGQQRVEDRSGDATHGRDRSTALKPGPGDVLTGRDDHAASPGRAAERVPEQQTAHPGAEVEDSNGRPWHRRFTPVECAGQNEHDWGLNGITPR